MKKIYLKPSIDFLTIIESGGIMEISGNNIDGVVTSEKDRDPSLEGGGTGDGTNMGAKRWDAGWDFDSWFTEED